ncbi:MAG TPA: response regulator [Holophaga sp.]|nr:response regulator [Holophaga sp.]
MSTIRVLAADDDPATLAFLVRVLNRAGMDTVAARDGAEALAHLRKNPESFDVLLLDLAMPRMDGWQVLKRVKASSTLRQIPVVLQTVSDSPEDMKRGMEAGAYYYLTKPFTQKVLLAIVRAAAQDVAALRVLHAEVTRAASPLALMTRGTFTYRTLAEGHELTNLLAKSCPDPARIVTGLSELLINALEHGNLGITYKEKGELLERNAWKAEVARRQALPENRDKRVEVVYERLPDRIRFEVKDMGKGFDWQAFLLPDVKRLFDNHGRGIFMAKMDSFDHLEYLGCGNHVVAEVRL